MGWTHESIKKTFTDPAQAAEFARETGVDALAVAIGTAHGNYRTQPELRIDRLKEIAAVVKCPLVLHGGTGLTEQDFHDCLQNGIQKINIATASYDASARQIKTVYQEKPEANYFDFSDAIVQGTYQNVKKHMEIFGLLNKA